MRLSSIAAFAAGAVVALGGAYVVQLDRDPGMDREQVRAIVAEQLAATPAALSTEEVREIAATHLQENPEVVIDAIRVYQRREELAEQTALIETVQANWSDIAERDDDPVLGNPDGDVTLVEFFDYRCGYCRRVFPEVHALHESDPNLRIVLKEFPILGPDSVFASRVSLASRKQGLMPEFHAAAMAAEGDLNEERVLEIARDIGLDIGQLVVDMKDPEIDRVFERNHALAEKLGIRGTPAFVTRLEIIPGAVGRERLEAAVAEVRKKDS